MLTYIVLGFSGLSLLGGFLFGMLRGFNRSVLRLLLIAACIAGAWFLRGVLVDLLLDIKIDGETIEEMLLAMFTTEGNTLPDSMSNLVFVLIQIIASVVCFVLLFAVLRLISWSIVYPILKLIVRQGEKKRALLGGVIGLVQGALVAFALCVPITGITGQIDTIVSSLSGVDMGGGTVIPAEVSEYLEAIEIKEYQESAIGKFYISVGNGVYNDLTSAKDRNGNNVSLDAAIRALNATLKVAESISNVSDVDFSNGITDENKDAIVGALRDIDKVMKDELSDEDAKRIVNELITGVLESTGEEGTTIIPDNFDIGKLDAGAAADAIEVIFEFTSQEGEEKSLTSEQAKTIVNGIAKNEEFITSITGEANLVGDISESDKTTMEQEITQLKNAGDIDDETAESLKKLLGITDGSSAVEP